MLINSLTLKNFLSFKKVDIDLKPLNIIIGPNGSGKSNFLESIELLRNAPDQLMKPIREGGGVRDWLWRGSNEISDATLDVILAYPDHPTLRYVLSFTAVNQRFEIIDEKIENEKPVDNLQKRPYFYYHFESGNPIINIKDPSSTYKTRSLQKEDTDVEKSILSQRRDPDYYPEITWIAQQFSAMKMYREWSFGRYTIPRLPQKADLPNDILESDASNIGLVLNRLRRNPDAKKYLLKALQELYRGIDDYDVQIEGGTVQVFFHEGQLTIPATRLSDGTLRYLCLLAILCHPNPPPVVCIEEPELGLHPDIMPVIANLLKGASERCQLIVTTHSDVLIDAMTDQPESIIVCERGEDGSTLKRLDADSLKPWLEKYRLGELWLRGNIGGTRW